MKLMLSGEALLYLYYNQPLREHDSDRLQELFRLLSCGVQSLRTDSPYILLEYDGFFCLNFGTPLTAVFSCRDVLYKVALRKDVWRA